MQLYYENVYKHQTITIHKKKKSGCRQCSECLCFIPLIPLTCLLNILTCFTWFNNKDNNSKNCKCPIENSSHYCCCYYGYTPDEICEVINSTDGVICCACDDCDCDSD